ncbi:hypothetical protein [Ruminiclostridium cellobioparum]|jgi:hypothetical protein|uniref:Uncharacterized protein n=1 Tax=Ruminiclostridium cellobioparum subsp. termitidis CT1112 TaxID=1195236 RepID=S0FKN6_RUMCE|nr:hypothetical protein [Ruminiclostridium cellobioparum]EMS72422.1 hypothetical protein CTER_1625 [Ruminiclostridium cellobioparum subsp. termitidis CT1112]
MNRTEFNETLEQLYQDIENENGNFVKTFGNDPKMLEQARVMAGVSLMAVDRYYSNLSLLESKLKKL